MKLKILYSIILSTILLFASCTKEDTTHLRWVPDGVDATFSLKIPSQIDAVSDEDKVGGIRIVSFVPSTAVTAPGELDVNGGKKTLPASGSITQILRTGVRDIYVFANEERVVGMSDLLNNIKNSSDLGAIKVPYGETIAPPFLCSYVQPNFDIKEEGDISVSAEMVRTVSKITLTLTYQWGEGKPLTEELVIDKVQVKHLPKYSYLIGKTYDGVDFTDSEILEGDILDNQSAMNNEYESKPLTIYIPEFIGASKGNNTYIEIRAHLKDNDLFVCTYKIPLGGLMESGGKVTGYDIPRNTAFSVDATIKSYGEQDNIFVKIIVLPWNVVRQDDEVGYFLNYDRAMHQNDSLLLDYENLYVTGDKIRIYCETNVGGWYASLYDQDGAKMVSSNPTSAVTISTKQEVSFTIDPLNASLNYDEYVVKIFHPVYAPEPSGNTIKTLHYVQADGLILNTNFKGWKPGKYGLQLARKGNVLPKDPVVGDDIKLPWSTKAVSTGIVSKDAGTGKSNTMAMVALGAEYEVANYCVKKLGNEWYLPTDDEASIIYKNFKILGANYSFAMYGFYWLSSEYIDDITQANYIYYENLGGIIGQSHKSTDAGFRCVRNL